MVVCMLDDKYPDMQEINDQPSKSDDVIITSFDHQSALNFVFNSEMTCSSKLMQSWLSQFIYVKIVMLNKLY